MYKTVAECYEGQSVFMTGGTGFLGKVILEKLLYSCPGLDKVYVMVRDKKSTIAQQRFLKVLEQPIFSRLRNENPQALDKIVPIVGDISEPKLGLNAQDEELLTSKVSFVFHVAATVKFNEPFEVAMNINVAGTSRVLELSHRMKNIKAFVYVSTAYSNTNRDVIDEVIYPAPASLNEIKKLLEIGITEKQVKDLIGNRPNTYTFTKAIAENLIADNNNRVPSVIVRPSVVSSSKAEPLVGWIDNWFGASALLTTTSKGLNRVLLAHPSNSLDLIPVDYVSNLIIVAASKCESSKEVKVYNCSSSAENPITMKRLANLTIEDSYKNKCYDVPLPFLYFTQYKWVVFLLTLILQTIPAYIGDIILSITGKKTRFVKIQAKTSLVRNTLEYFTSNSWVIRASKTRALAQSLSPADKETFPCDPADIVWDEYIPTYCEGIRKFLLQKK
ncbi:putative fatty acyl-CoA reductase CG5065 [Nymphalis io]|uniref:putative fatty acyl-CoA reductase CG5065 n=1 Tax=Inachis io TaxID=171585 RepID=UPI0021676708|nr:putative fatty acyl-CoA reductase CG5065 [Nymphalis io]